MSSSISETTRSRKEPCLESREVVEGLEFHVSPRNTGSGAMNVLEHCHDATASFSPSRGLVFCAELHHGVGGELIDITLLSLFVLPVHIRDAQFHGYQRTRGKFKVGYFLDSPRIVSCVILAASRKPASRSGAATHFLDLRL